MLNIHRHDIPYYGLNARGVKSIHLFEDDIATALTTFNLDDDIHVISSRGHLITIENKPISKRGRKGFLAIEPLKSQPHIPFVMKSTSQISEDMHIYMYTSQQIHIKKIHELISKHNKYGKFILDSKTEFIQYVHFDFIKEDHYQPLIIDESLKKPKVIKPLENNIDNPLDNALDHALDEENNHALESDNDSKTESNPIDLVHDPLDKEIDVHAKANDDVSIVKQSKTKQKSESLPKKQTIILNRLDLFDDEE
jgi:hypothetical protein